jgi:hypothetical protein
VRACVRACVALRRACRCACLSVLRSRSLSLRPVSFSSSPLPASLPAHRPPSPIPTTTPHPLRCPLHPYARHVPPCSCLQARNRLAAVRPSTPLNHNNPPRCTALTINPGQRTPTTTSTKMRRQTPIAHLLYAHLFPRPRDDDPPSFAAHLALNLVQEVRVEVGLFYGDLDTIEAKYPGLDYCYSPHRMRLGRFPHHARLFAAFDELNLTYQEIQDFCCWEGTRWARERYEKDENCIIEDTTGDFIPRFVEPKQRQNEPRRGSIVRKTDISIVFQDAPADLRTRRVRNSQQQAVVYIPATSEDPVEEGEDEEDEDEDEDEDDQQDSNMSDSASDTTASPHSEQPQPDAQRSRARDPFLAGVEQLDNELQHEISINAQLQAALAQGGPLTPEQEQMLKDQCEQNAVQQRALDARRSAGYGQRALAGEASASARAAA